MGAEIAHSHSLGLRALDKAPHRSFIKNKFQSMLAAEFLRKLTRTSFEHLRFKLVSLDPQSVEHILWLAYERCRNTKLAQSRPSEGVFVIAEQFFEYGEQSTCTGFFFGRSFREQAQSFILETDLDAVSAEGTLVLPKQTPLGILHNVEKVIRIQVFTDHAHRQSADEFRLEAVFDKILRRYMLEQFVVHHLNRFCAKSDL